MTRILIKRGARADLDAAASASGLAAGEPYLITDESRLAVGVSANAYEAMAKQSEAGGSATRLIMLVGAISAVSVGDYLAFGASNTGSGRGAVLPYGGNVVALGLSAKTLGTGPMELEVVKNDVATGATIQLVNPALSSYVVLGTKVPFAAGDWLNAVVNLRNGYGKIDMSIFCEV